MNNMERKWALAISVNTEAISKLTAEAGKIDNLSKNLSKMYDIGNKAINDSINANKAAIDSMVAASRAARKEAAAAIKEASELQGVSSQPGPATKSKAKNTKADPSSSAMPAMGPLQRSIEVTSLKQIEQIKSSGILISNAIKTSATAIKASLNGELVTKKNTKGKVTGVPTPVFVQQITSAMKGYSSSIEIQIRASGDSLEKSINNLAEVQNKILMHIARIVGNRAISNELNPDSVAQNLIYDDFMPRNIKASTKNFDHTSSGASPPVVSVAEKRKQMRDERARKVLQMRTDLEERGLVKFNKSGEASLATPAGKQIRESQIGSKPIDGSGITNQKEFNLLEKIYLEIKKGNAEERSTRRRGRNSALSIEAPGDPKDVEKKIINSNIPPVRPGVNSTLAYRNEASGNFTDLHQDRGRGMRRRGVIEAAANRVGDTAGRAVMWGSGGALGFAAVEGARNSIQVIGDFEKALKNVESVLNPLDRDIGSLSERAKELGKTYGQSIVEVADAMSIYAQQGRGLEDIKVQTRTSVLAANVTNDELTAEKSSEAFTAAQKQFQLSSRDSMRILDAWVAVADSTSVGVKALTESLKQAGSVARLSGVDFDTFNGIAAAMGEATRKSGEQIGAALKFIFQNVYEEDSMKALQNASIFVKDLGGNFKTSTKIFTELSAKWDMLSKVQQQNIGVSIAGVRRLNDFMVMMETTGRAQDVRLTSMTSDGSAERRNEILMDSLRKQQDVLIANWQTMMVNIGDSGVLKAMKGVTVGLSDTISVLNKLTEATKGFGGAAVIAAAGIGAVAVARGSGISEVLNAVGPKRQGQDLSPRGNHDLGAKAYLATRDKSGGGWRTYTQPFDSSAGLSPGAKLSEDGMVETHKRFEPRRGVGRNTLNPNYNPKGMLFGPDGKALNDAASEPMYLRTTRRSRLKDFARSRYGFRQKGPTGKLTSLNPSRRSSEFGSLAYQFGGAGIGAAGIFASSQLDRFSGREERENRSESRSILDVGSDALGYGSAALFAGSILKKPGRLTSGKGFLNKTSNLFRRQGKIRGGSLAAIAGGAAAASGASLYNYGRENFFSGPGEQESENARSKISVATQTISDLERLKTWSNQGERTFGGEISDQFAEVIRQNLKQFDVSQTLGDFGTETPDSIKEIIEAATTRRAQLSEIVLESNSKMVMESLSKSLDDPQNVDKIRSSLAAVITQAATISSDNDSEGSSNLLKRISSVTSDSRAQEALGATEERLNMQALGQYMLAKTGFSMSEKAFSMAFKDQNVSATDVMNSDNDDLIKTLTKTVTDGGEAVQIFYSDIKTAGNEYTRSVRKMIEANSDFIQSMAYDMKMMEDATSLIRPDNGTDSLSSSITQLEGFGSFQRNMPREIPTDLGDSNARDFIERIKNINISNKGSDVYGMAGISEKLVQSIGTSAAVRKQMFEESKSYMQSEFATNPEAKSEIGIKSSETLTSVLGQENSEIYKQLVIDLKTFRDSKNTEQERITSQRINDLIVSSSEEFSGVDLDTNADELRNQSSQAIGSLLRAVNSIQERQLSQTITETPAEGLQQAKAIARSQAQELMKSVDFAIANLQEQLNSDNLTPGQEFPVKNLLESQQQTRNVLKTYLDNQLTANKQQETARFQTIEAGRVVASSEGSLGGMSGLAAIESQLSMLIADFRTRSGKTESTLRQQLEVQIDQLKEQKAQVQATMMATINRASEAVDNARFMSMMGDEGANQNVANQIISATKESINDFYREARSLFQDSKGFDQLNPGDFEKAIKDAMGDTAEAIIEMSDIVKNKASADYLLASDRDRALLDFIESEKASGRTDKEIFSDPRIRSAARDSSLVRDAVNKDMLGDYMPKILDLMERINTNIGRNPDGTLSMSSDVTDRISSQIGIAPASSSPPSGASAVDSSGRIRTDGTPAVLHQGEIVLNKKQSDAFVKNQYSSGTMPDHLIKQRDELEKEFKVASGLGRPERIQTRKIPEISERVKAMMRGEGLSFMGREARNVPQILEFMDPSTSRMGDYRPGKTPLGRFSFASSKAKGVARVDYASEKRPLKSFLGISYHEMQHGVNQALPTINEIKSGVGEEAHKRLSAFVLDKINHSDDRNWKRASAAVLKNYSKRLEIDPSSVSAMLKSNGHPQFIDEVISHYVQSAMVSGSKVDPDLIALSEINARTVIDSDGKDLRGRVNKKNAQRRVAGFGQINDFLKEKGYDPRDVTRYRRPENFFGLGQTFRRFEDLPLPIISGKPPETVVPEPPVAPKIKAPVPSSLKEMMANNRYGVPEEALTDKQKRAISRIHEKRVRQGVMPEEPRVPVAPPEVKKPLHPHLQVMLEKNRYGVPEEMLTENQRNAIRRTFRKQIKRGDIPLDIPNSSPLNYVVEALEKQREAARIASIKPSVLPIQRRGVPSILESLGLPTDSSGMPEINPRPTRAGLGTGRIDYKRNPARIISEYPDDIQKSINAYSKKKELLGKLDGLYGKFKDSRFSNNKYTFGAMALAYGVKRLIPEEMQQTIDDYGGDFVSALGTTQLALNASKTGELLGIRRALPVVAGKAKSIAGVVANKTGSMVPGFVKGGAKAAAGFGKKLVPSTVAKAATSASGLTSKAASGLGTVAGRVAGSGVGGMAVKGLGKIAVPLAIIDAVVDGAQVVGRVGIATGALNESRARDGMDSIGELNPLSLDQDAILRRTASFLTGGMIDRESYENRSAGYDAIREYEKQNPGEIQDRTFAQKFNTLNPTYHLLKHATGAKAAREVGQTIAWQDQIDKNASQQMQAFDFARGTVLNSYRNPSEETLDGWRKAVSEINERRFSEQIAPQIETLNALKAQYKANKEDLTQDTNAAKEIYTFNGDISQDQFEARSSLAMSHIERLRQKSERLNSLGGRIREGAGSISGMFNSSAMNGEDFINSPMVMAKREEMLKEVEDASYEIFHGVRSSRGMQGDTLPQQAQWLKNRIASDAKLKEIEKSYIERFAAASPITASQTKIDEIKNTLGFNPEDFSDVTALSDIRINAPKTEEKISEILNGINAYKEKLHDAGLAKELNNSIQINNSAKLKYQNSRSSYQTSRNADGRWQVTVGDQTTLVSNQDATRELMDKNTSRVQREIENISSVNPQISGVSRDVSLWKILRIDDFNKRLSEIKLPSGASALDEFQEYQNAKSAMEAAKLFGLGGNKLGGRFGERISTASQTISNKEEASLYANLEDNSLTLDQLKTLDGLRGQITGRKIPNDLPDILPRPTIQRHAGGRLSSDETVIRGSGSMQEWVMDSKWVERFKDSVMGLEGALGGSTAHDMTMQADAGNYMQSMNMNVSGNIEHTGSVKLEYDNGLISSLASQIVDLLNSQTPNTQFSQPRSGDRIPGGITG